MTSFCGLFFVLEDLRRWDELKDSYLDLYAGKFNYTLLLVAAVITAHIFFLIIWIREYLIMHRKFLLNKTPKPI